MGKKEEAKPKPWRQAITVHGQYGHTPYDAQELVKHYYPVMYVVETKFSSVDYDDGTTRWDVTVVIDQVKLRKLRDADD